MEQTKVQIEVQKYSIHRGEDLAAFDPHLQRLFFLFLMAIFYCPKGQIGLENLIFKIKFILK